MTRCLRSFSLLGIGASLAACAQVLGVDTYTNAPASKTACDLPYPSTGCASCVTTHCCGESASCAKDQACAAQARCLADCGGDPSCRAECAIARPVSQARDASALSACLASECEEACGLSCGLSLGDYGEFPPDAASECHDCIGANACPAARACAASSDCDALKRCYASCRTTDCRLACYGAHDAGRSLALSLSSDTGMCDVACARGGNWSCVDHVSWPKPKSETTIFTVEFLGRAGADVVVCDRLDPPCGDPKEQGKTDDMGFVVLEFQNRLSRTSQGLDGFLRLTHPDIAEPLFVSWGFPLSEPEMALVESADLFEARAVRLGDRQALEGTTKSWGVTLNPTRGNVIATVVDCMGAQAPGVELTLEPSDPDATIIYNFVPGESATRGRNNTVFMFNVRPGAVNVIATPLALGRRSSTQGIDVRRGTASTILMLPTP